LGDNAGVLPAALQRKVGNCRSQQASGAFSAAYYAWFVRLSWVLPNEVNVSNHNLDVPAKSVGAALARLLLYSHSRNYEPPWRITSCL
jgi:hypothetical protein